MRLCGPLAADPTARMLHALVLALAIWWGLWTIILMPLTYDITVGIGAGFISWVLIKVVRGKFDQIHWLMWLVSIAFIVYFAQDWINGLIK